MPSLITPDVLAPSAYEVILEAPASIAPAPVAQAAQATQQVQVVEGADIVEVWGMDSFPASDPPANW